MESLIFKTAAMAIFAGSAAGCGDSVAVQVGDEVQTLGITLVNGGAVLTTLALQVGDSAWLDVSALNALGLAVNVTPTWSSTNQTAASVTPAGVVHALTVGSTNIIASYGGLTATVPTTVSAAGGPPPPPPPSSVYPNQPTGMTLVTQWNGTSKSMPSGWSEPTGLWNGRVQVVADLSNPLGTDQVLQVNYPVGANSAGVPIINQFPGGPYNQIYIMYRIYYEPNWELIGHKNFYWGAHPGSRANTNSSPSQYYVTHEANGDAHLTDQNGNSVNVLNMANAWDGDLGRWVNMEIHAVAETSPGANDGRVSYWHDGVLLGSATNVDWVQSNAGAVGFNGFEWYTQRNGANTRASWFRIGELYISVK